MCSDSIQYRAIGVIGVPSPMEWINRPTFQQADDLTIAGARAIDAAPRTNR